jgi:hypothetical protein
MSSSDHLLVPIAAQMSADVTSGASGEADDKTLNYIAEKVAQHQCILFLGSAIHAPSPKHSSRFHYPEEKCPPIGGQLSRLLAAQCGFSDPENEDLQRVSQYFESTTKSRFRLVEEIGNAVHRGKEPSPVLHALASLEFPIVITTNYDDLYERVLKRRALEEGLPGQPYDLGIYSANTKVKLKTKDCLPTPDPRRPYILKMHGDISKPESIVITDEDYIQFVLRMSDKHPYHPVGKNVLAYLNKWTTLFIGYRLTDYNLRLLFKTLRWKMDAAQIPPTYAVDRDPDQLIRDVYENQRRYVTFIIEDVWKFVPRLYAAVKKEEMPQ